MALTFKKLHPTFVAEVSAVELRTLHDPATLDEIRAGRTPICFAAWRKRSGAGLPCATSCTLKMRPAKRG